MIEEELVKRMSLLERRTDGLDLPERPLLLAAPFLDLPMLRGLWVASVASGGTWHDISGHGNHLTYNGNPVSNYSAQVAYWTLDGTGDYFDITDAASGNDFDVAGTETYVAAAARGLTWGGWFYPTQSGVFEQVFSKWGAAAARSYDLRFTAADQFVSAVSDDGTNSDTATSSAVSVNAWYFVMGRFDPATSIDVFVNGTWTTAATARASAFNTATNLAIGGSGVGTNLWTGNAAMGFLCAAYVSDAMISNRFQQTRALFGV